MDGKEVAAVTFSVGVSTVGAVVLIITVELTPSTNSVNWRWVALFTAASISSNVPLLMRS